MPAALPTAVAIGPFTFYLYGLGLAITAWVSFSYLERRLKARGLAVGRWPRFATAVILSGLLGARAAHVATNWSYYHDHIGSLVALWQGGLASFGGLALAVPTGIVLARRYWPETPLLEFTDTLVVGLTAGWALGRVLGPQFMVAGGGHQTHQWFGLTYAGQVGRRVPVPLIQGAEDALLWLGLQALERRTSRPGLVTGVALFIWGLVRSVDERWLLGEQGHTGSVAVQGAGLLLSVLGLFVVWQSHRRTHNLTNSRL